MLTYGKKLRMDQKANSAYGQKNRMKNNRAKLKRSCTSSNGIIKNSGPNDTVAYVMDSGAYMVKTGMSSLDQPTIIPNCIMKVKSEKKRNYIGSQIEECRDFSGLYYLLPCSRGFIVKWDVQKGVWDYIFSKSVCPIEDKPVVMTQPLFNFKSIQECIDEIFFEEYDVKALYRANPTDLSRYHYTTEVLGKDKPCLIVDSGYSYTHVVPYINGEKYLEAVRRLDIGGKFLTNILKDTVSYRMYDVRDETYVINQVKEDTFFVSDDYNRDLITSRYSGTKNTIVKNYVLPDFNTIKRGYIQNGLKSDVPEHCQTLSINNERFTIPEILFKPNDQNMRGLGIPEAIVKSIELCPSKYQRALAKNIVITGGNANIPGFKERIVSDVTKLLPDYYEIQVYKPENPVTFSWKGGKYLTGDPNFSNLLVTKQEYEELGVRAIQEKFKERIVPHDKEVQKEVTPETISYIEHVKKHRVFEKDDTQNSAGESSRTQFTSEVQSGEAQENSNDQSETRDTRARNKKIIDRPFENNVELEENLFDFNLRYGFEPCDFSYV